MTCYRCDSEVTIEGKVPRESTCSHCHAALHCCRNCRFYSPAAHNHCTDPSAEWVRDKVKGNFCEYFTFRTETAGQTRSSAERARAAFDNLFKK